MKDILIESIYLAQFEPGPNPCSRSRQGWCSLCSIDEALESEPRQSIDDKLDSVVAVDRVKCVIDFDQNRGATHIIQQPSPFLFVFEDRSRIEQFRGLRGEGLAVASLEGNRLYWRERSSSW